MTVRDTVTLAPSTVTDYRRLRALRTPRTYRDVPVVETSHIPALALRVAVNVAGGDLTRLWVHADGGVCVLNQPRRRRARACPACGSIR